MPVPSLNGAATQATYVDALTVQFTPKSGFQLQVSNNNVFYQLATPGHSGGLNDVIWENGEHLLVPSLSNFDEVDAQALGSTKLAGIRIRSAQPTASAIVSVS